MSCSSSFTSFAPSVQDYLRVMLLRGVVLLLFTQVFHLEELPMSAEVVLAELAASAGGRGEERLQLRFVDFLVPAEVEADIRNQWS